MPGVDGGDAEGDEQVALAGARRWLTDGRPGCESRAVFVTVDGPTGS